MKAPARTPALPDAGEPLAEVEAMIVRLIDLRQREPGRERKADYQAAIDRLHALAYRLERDAVPGRTIGLPAAPQAAKPATPAPGPAKAATKPPQAALPLGPVIVVARKPKPR